MALPESGELSSVALGEESAEHLPGVDGLQCGAEVGVAILDEALVALQRLPVQPLGPGNLQAALREWLVQISSGEIQATAPREQGRSVVTILEERLLAVVCGREADDHVRGDALQHHEQLAYDGLAQRVGFVNQVG